MKCLTQGHRWSNNMNENIENLLTQKGLDWSEQVIPFEGDINSHAKWAYRNIYQNPYSNYIDEALPRGGHGILHVARASLWGKVFLNLYKNFGNDEANALNVEDEKLIQIAILFHDSGRERGGKDLWDCDSALLFYFYLKKTLGHIFNNQYFNFLI